MKQVLKLVLYLDGVPNKVDNDLPKSTRVTNEDARDLLRNIHGQLLMPKKTYLIQNFR